VSLPALQRWLAALFTPVDAASLGVFRIVFGMAVAVESWLYLAKGWVEAIYVSPTIHFTYLYFDFVHPWPGRWMHVHFWIMSLLALLVAAGCWYRVASALLFVAYTYVFLLEQSVYMNHHYLIALLAFLLTLMPAERAYSLAHWRHPEVPATVPRWTVWLLRYQLVLVYFYGGIAKLNADWLQGEPMRSVLTERLVTWPLLGPYIPAALVAYVIAYGGIVVDFAIPALLCTPRTFRLGFGVALVFHLLNAAFLRIGIFSYLMIGAILIFQAPDWPRRWWREPWQPPRQIASPATAVHTTTWRWATVLFVHAYVLAQVLIPLRHLLYPGPVAWSEEGHRFSWRMMLRNKQSEVTITATNPATGRIWMIDPSQDLTPRQLAKLHTFPDILLQYVHHHRDRLRSEGVADPEIHVQWLCSLNGAPRRPLVDATINLAAEPRSLRHARWIEPPH